MDRLVRDLGISIVGAIVGGLLVYLLGNYGLSTFFQWAPILVVVLIGTAIFVMLRALQRRRGTARVIGLILAIELSAFSFLIIFGPFVSSTPQPYGADFAISNAQPSQQLSINQGSTQQGEVTVVVPSASLVEEFYYRSTALHDQIFLNVTALYDIDYPSFSQYLRVQILPDSYVHDSIGVHLFLVDPQGVIQGTFPSGDLPTITQGPNSNYPYSNTSGFAASNVLSQSNAKTLNSTGLVFSFTIPQSELSLGTWKIFAFVQNETGPYQYSTNPGKILAGAASTFIVSTEPVNRATSTNYLKYFTAVVGGAFVAYGVFDNIIESAESRNLTVREWGAKNWKMIVGIAILTALAYALVLT